MATNPVKRSSKQPAVQQEVIDPRWLLKALGLTIAAATVLAYLTLCLLIYQGGWQLILHPSTKIDATPHVPFQTVRFDAAPTGKPRLTGWWIPAEIPTVRTILFLHDGSGSLSATVPKLDLLHTAGVNIFAIDYRGYGESDPPHPTEARMAEDAAAAYEYLVATRHITPGAIVPYGEGLGAALATHLVTASHFGVHAVIVDNPDPDAFIHAIGSARSRLLPMRLLVRESFDIRADLADPRVAKLLLVNSPFPANENRPETNQALFRTATGAKITVTFGNGDSSQAYVQSITRFLDEYVPSQPSSIQ